MVAAARSINRTLKNAGLDIHVLAAAIERGGREPARTPNAPAWHSVACECAAHPERLRSEKERAFVADMVVWTKFCGEPTERQAQWLRSIYCAGAPMTEKPKTFSGDLAHLPQALLPLTEQKRWVVWPWELRKSKSGKEKWTKPPRQARDPAYNARSNDPDTWGTYDEAVAAVAAGNADGIGYMLLGSGIGAIDLDQLSRIGHGKLKRWAEQLQAEAHGAYQEVTVSGSGLRIIGTASGPEMQRKFTFERDTGAGIELYRNTARYITVSRP